MEDKLQKEIENVFDNFQEEEAVKAKFTWGFLETHDGRTVEVQVILTAEPDEFLTPIDEAEPFHQVMDLPKPKEGFMWNGEKRN